ncbi:chemotaxis-specific protein-glutamate methyltransferase CheB [Roseomonas nepalensis]|uniref:Protein-glutamate methylesterase/protein-glutamine glutaminase n=1 Tax=Muricoccus nepalensis TaxID=1854500 RepID=A0A502FIL1_9PROT|nr:chemotaxis-specific protein-glutamate methyltransferase CheB [Roseomonas nepalensis]TPG48973.1 chemotaxis-specific protein-glutamate methyltransferase CheB [Roseomonas nepalensis]
MICDDSQTVRGILAGLLSADPEIEVVSRVGDGQQALDALAEARPDVVLLDLEMPVLDGLAALPRLLRADPRLAVIVASAVTQRGAAEAMSALRAGASDYIPKPGAGRGGASDPVFRAELLEKVKGWARMRRRTAALAAAPVTPVSAVAVVSPNAGPATPVMSNTTADEPVPSDTRVLRSATTMPPPRPTGPPPSVFKAAPPVKRVLARVPAPGVASASELPPPALSRAGKASGAPSLLAIGSSTGGPQALAAFLRSLNGAPVVPIVIVQHMPAGFTAMLADHLDRLGSLRVAEARDGEVLQNGRAYVAPGDKHLLIERGTGGLTARLRDDPPENFCRPAVDPMLRSAQRACDGRVLAVILTGMGQDGLEGCRSLVAAGGIVLAQDEASSVVWGMPGAVARAGLAREILPPERLGPRVSAMLSGVGTEAGRMAS